MNFIVFVHQSMTYFLSNDVLARGIENRRVGRRASVRMLITYRLLETRMHCNSSNERCSAGIQY